MYSTVITIPQSDIDPIYLHLHHAGIVKVFETARLRWLEAIGCPNDYFISQGLLLILKSIEVEFKREVRAGEYVVTCGNLSVEGKDIVVAQTMLNSKEKVAATAKVVSCFLHNGRSIVPPEKFMDGIAKEIR